MNNKHRRRHVYPLAFDARVEMIITTLQIQYETHNWLSDDDVLDACQRWTLTPYGAEDDEDYRNLTEEIFDLLSD